MAILLYGFPPGVGATGTAALLNVPRSLEHTLAALQREGYNVGGEGPVDGEAIVSALQAQVHRNDSCSSASDCTSVNMHAVSCPPLLPPFTHWSSPPEQEQHRVVSRGVKGLGAGDAAASGAEAVGAEVSPKRLKEMLTYPASWGPTEWVSASAVVS